MKPARMRRPSLMDTLNLVVICVALGAVVAVLVHVIEQAAEFPLLAGLAAALLLGLAYFLVRF